MANVAFAVAWPLHAAQQMSHMPVTLSGETLLAQQQRGQHKKVVVVCNSKVSSRTRTHRGAHSAPFLYMCGYLYRLVPLFVRLVSLCTCYWAKHHLLCLSCIIKAQHQVSSCSRGAWMVGEGCMCLDGQRPWPVCDRRCLLGTLHLAAFVRLVIVYCCLEYVAGWLFCKFAKPITGSLLQTSCACVTGSCDNAFGFC